MLGICQHPVCQTLHFQLRQSIPTVSSRCGDTLGSPHWCLSGRCLGGPTRPMTSHVVSPRQRCCHSVLPKLPGSLQAWLTQARLPCMPYYFDIPFKQSTQTCQLYNIHQLILQSLRAMPLRSRLHKVDLCCTASPHIGCTGRQCACETYSILLTAGRFVIAAELCCKHGCDSADGAPAANGSC